ncbi:MAG: sulfatase [Planctomycetaceae bacterium]|nr:sulfatase [Planctomycetaceae bacterium]
MVRIFFVFFVAFFMVFAGNTISAETPNVIIIFIDDMGYGDIGPFGSDTSTPNLDRLAHEGRRFTNFVVSSAVCSASRSALMTGCLHRRVDIHGALFPRTPVGLNPDEETIAEVCKKKNYATACFGKWHLGDAPEFWPLNQGFDEFFGLPYSNDMWPDLPSRANFPDLQLIEGDRRLDEVVTGEMQKNLTTWYTERAVRFIETNKDRPFFLYLPHTMVHIPLYVSDKFAGKSGKGLYGDVVMEIDWSVGQIYDTLVRLNLDRNTLLVFTSDNGPWLCYGNHGGTAGPLREGKGTSFEGGIREPTIVWWPGKVPANSECDQLASTIDLLPTIAHLIGAPLPEKKIDGKDIRPLLFGEKDAVSPHDAFPIYYDRQLQAIRDTRWKLVFPHQSRTMNGREPGKDGRSGQYAPLEVPLALYNLLGDIGETTDCSAEHPEIVERLQKAADAVIADLGNRDQKGPGVRPAGRTNEK